MTDEPGAGLAAEERGVYAEVRHLDLSERLEFDDQSFADTIEIRYVTLTRR